MGKQLTKGGKMEKIITVQPGETFGSIAWQNRCVNEIMAKIDNLEDLTHGEKIFLEVQTGHVKRENLL